MNILPFGFPMGGAPGAGTAQLPPSGFGFAVALDGAIADAMPGPNGAVPTLPVVEMGGAPLPELALPAVELPTETSGVLPPPMSMAQLLTTASRIPAPAAGQAPAPQEASAETLAPGAAQQAAVTPALPAATAGGEAALAVETPAPVTEIQPEPAKATKGRKALAADVAELPVDPANPTPATAPANAVAAVIPAPVVLQQPAAPAAPPAEQAAATPSNHARKPGPRAHAAGGTATAETAGGDAPANRSGFGDAVARLADSGKHGAGTGTDTGQQPASPQGEKPAVPTPGAIASFQTAPAVDPARHAASAAPAAQAAAPGEAEIAARPGHLGQSLGVEIARKIGSGEETLRVRLNPVELGRIEVTLAFDDRGSLQATMRTESAQALDLLRQDVPDLARTLDQAGVRTDAQSFRFENRAGDGGGSQSSPHQQRGNQQHASAEQGDFETDDQPYRAIRGDGRVDLLA